MKIKRVTMGQSACSVHFADGTSLLGIPHDAAEAFEHERRLGYAECERKNAGQIQALKARLQTAEKAAHEWRERAEGMWSKADVEAAFFEWWIDGAREHTNSAGAWSDFRDRIEAEESGA